jgi:hypothetical protein
MDKEIKMHDVLKKQEGPEGSAYRESLRLHRPARLTHGSSGVYGMLEVGKKWGQKSSNDIAHTVIHVDPDTQAAVVRASGYMSGSGLHKSYSGPELKVIVHDGRDNQVYAEIQYDRETRKLAETRAREIAANIHVLVEACEQSQREAEAKTKAEEEKHAAQIRERLEGQALLIDARALLEQLGPQFFEPGDIRSVKGVIERMVQENRKKLGLE